jgi:hypothetical protein
VRAELGPALGAARGGDQGREAVSLGPALTKELE